MTCHTEWALFDGALLLGTDAHERLMAHHGLHALYADEGDDAAAVGPLLLPACPLASEIASSLTGTQSFACAKLVCKQPADALVAHLLALRELHSNARAYYFRFADHRALGAVSGALDADQLAGMMGPIAEWHYVAPDGRRKILRANQTAESLPLPLRLRAEQWHDVLASNRIGELYESTEACAGQVQPPCLGDQAQRYAWTKRAYGLLHRLGIEAMPIRVAANLAIWQSAGRLLDDTIFHYTLREVQAGDSIDRVFEFGRASSPRGDRT